MKDSYKLYISREPNGSFQSGKKQVRTQGRYKIRSKLFYERNINKYLKVIEYIQPFAQLPVSNYQWVITKFNVENWRVWGIK